MRILQCMASMDATKGGPTNAATNLAEALAELGHEVVTVSHDDGAESPPQAVSQGQVQTRSFPLTTAHWEFSNEYRRWLKRNIATYDLVIIHSVFLAHAYFAARYAAKAGIPYVLRPHGSYTVSDMAKNRRIKTAYARSVDRKTVANAEYLFCTSPAEALDTEKITNKKCRVIPLGVSESFFAAHRETGEIDRNEVVFVGRIARKKGVDLLVDAVSTLRAQGSPVTLSLYGPIHDQGLIDTLEDRVAQDGLQEVIRFKGFIDKAEQISVYSQAGIFALPSTHENFGIGAAEALATGVPAILSPGVSHSDLPSIGNAARVVPREVPEIADAISEIMNFSTHDYLQMSRSARELAKANFSWINTAQQVLSTEGVDQRG